MSASWELILHHDYRGVPGVVFDRSPGRGAHGTTRGLAPSDFLADGESAGSGAVRFHGGNTAIRVDLRKPWSILNGLDITMVCKSDMLKRDGTLLDAGSFRIETGAGALHCTVVGAGRTASGQIDTSSVVGGGWTTVSMGYGPGLHFGYEERSSPAGSSLGTFSDPEWCGPVQPVTRLAVGNRLTGGHGADGLIDDVQIRRPDPLQIDRNFRDRPVDISVRHCWDDWGRNLIRLLNENQRCARQIVDLLIRAQNSALADLRRDEISAQLQQSAAEYTAHWRSGRLDQIPVGTAHFIDFLRSRGIDISANAELRELLDDRCFRELIDNLPVLTCDPEFTGMLTAIAQRL